MGLDQLLDDVQTVAVICNQWGDTGKGKFSDYFAASWADVIARGTGGNNAGHTVVVNGQERVFHILPAGIAHDSLGKKTILGNGMVLNLEVLSQELDELQQDGGTYNNLMISQDAHIIMPYHIARDQAKDQSQQNGGIGTTGRGIGPCYSDKVARKGITVEDLFDKDALQQKIKKAQERYPEQDISADDIMSYLQPFSDRIKPFVRDTVSDMHDFVRQGKNILLEGAQGLLLSIEHGTYPYVTSSDCSLNGTASGVGLSAAAIDLPLGVVKFPFMTRVGGGPFPTELGGAHSEEYCAKGNDHDIFYEARNFAGMDIDLNRVRESQERKNPDDIRELAALMKGVHSHINSHGGYILDLINKKDDSFLQGIGIRLAANEYGATTARPRRTGWTDALAARYAVNMSGPKVKLILTKPDCLSGADEFNIAYGYKDQNGSVVTSFPRREKELRNLSPIYRAYPGYGDISDITNYDNLPRTLRHAIGDFERYTGGDVVAVSVGAERDQTIIR